MFSLGIQYLNGFVAAEGDGGRPEWPPHPGRVFMALAAAHFQTGADADERRALIWLEGLEESGGPAAPCISAPGASARAAETQFVPVPDKPVWQKEAGKPNQSPPPALQSAPGIMRERQPRTFSRAWVGDQPVFLTWPEVDVPEPVRSPLAGLCAKVTRIGHPTSLVQMWLAEDHVGAPNWVPDEERAETYLRLAPQGTLKYLEDRFNAHEVEAFADLRVTAADATDKKAQRAARKVLRSRFPGGAPPQLRPELSVSGGYAPARSPEAEDLIRGTVLSPHLIVRRLERRDGPYRHLDLACALAVATRWREALLSRCNGDPEAVRSALSGHDAAGSPLEAPHVAFLPLGFVGHDHADGHLLGMGIGLPRGLSRDERRGVLRALGRVQDLRLGRLGVWRLVPVTETRPARSLISAAWTADPRGATQWSTVTPIAFDRHPKAKDKRAYREEVAAMVVAGCARIGLPNPRSVIVSPISAHAGVPPARAFPRLCRKDGSLRRHTHAILVFDAPVCGPVLLGAGRYRGYGLCRPIDGHLPDGAPS